ncbi:MAG: DUF2975 domain-containing protein [Chloroflexota bacterium]|nr:MAG: DUF2975 domain-containing protein [Chloroflexota bacterium]
MSTTKNQKLPRIVKIILDIIYGLLLVISAFLILWIAFSPWIMKVSDIVITSSVPVAIGSGTDPRFEVSIAGAESESKGINFVYVNEAQGVLRMETTDWYLIFISNISKLIIALGGIYIVYLLRALIDALLQGEVFTHKNVVLVRRIGYAVLIVAFMQAAAMYFAAKEVLNQLNINEPALGAPSPFEAGVILASLLILILAQVWSYGLELEHERTLTI